MVLDVCFLFVASLLLIIDETFSYCTLSSGENWVEKSQIVQYHCVSIERNAKNPDPTP